jgi:hypothetical protein
MGRSSCWAKVGQIEQIVNPARTPSKHFFIVFPRGLRIGEPFEWTLFFPWRQSQRLSRLVGIVAQNESAQLRGAKIGHAG